MRPRHLLFLLPLALIPVALALLLTGGGSSSGPSRPGAAQVSLRLVGGSGKQSVTVCGSTHHYAVYRTGAVIGFRGAVSSAGGWTVRVKLKACQGGTFEPAGEVKPAHVLAQEFHGHFQAPVPGYYFARAELRQGGRVIVRSDKRYFQVR